MILLDTDTFSLLSAGHPQVTARFAKAEDEVATTLITRIEALEGRFAFVLRAADGASLFRAQEWLQRTEADLAPFPAIPFTDASVAEFDRLRQNKKLRKTGRADLLIACIALTHRAVLVTRNLRHFQLVPSLRLENWAD
jgi:tRNA(fMet)-specific endonuclease VapC